MATHSSTLAWKIPWTEEPGRLQSMGLQRVGLDWATSLSLSVLLRILDMRLLDRILDWTLHNSRGTIYMFCVWMRLPLFVNAETSTWHVCCVIQQGTSDTSFCLNFLTLVYFTTYPIPEAKCLESKWFLFFCIPHIYSSRKFCRFCFNPKSNAPYLLHLWNSTCHHPDQHCQTEI